MATILQHCCLRSRLPISTIKLTLQFTAMWWRCFPSRTTPPAVRMSGKLFVNMAEFSRGSSETESKTNNWLSAQIKGSRTRQRSLQLTEAPVVHEHWHLLLPDFVTRKTRKAWRHTKVWTSATYEDANKHSFSRLCRKFLSDMVNCLNLLCGVTSPRFVLAVS